MVSEGLTSRRASSNSFDVLDIPAQSSASTRKRKKKHSKRVSLQEEYPVEVTRAPSPNRFESATSSPVADYLDGPFAPEHRRLERTFTDLTQVLCA